MRHELPSNRRHHPTHRPPRRSGSLTLARIVGYVFETFRQHRIDAVISNKRQRLLELDTALLEWTMRMRAGDLKALMLHYLYMGCAGVLEMGAKTYDKHCLEDQELQVTLLDRSLTKMGVPKI